MVGICEVRLRDGEKISAKKNSALATLDRGELASRLL